MKLALKICLLCLLPFFAKSQSIQKLDSLHHALKMAENDSVRMDVLNGFYSHYAESNRDSAMFYTDLALATSKKINQPLWTAFILINKAYLLLKQGNLSLSFKLLNESMAIAKDEKSENNIYVPESLREGWDPHERRILILGGVFHNIGNAYSQAGNAEKAISSFKEVIRITEENKEKNSFLHACMNIGSIYLELNQLDSASHYAGNAIVYSNSSGFKTYQGNILKIIGDIFSKQNQLDSAKYFYWKSLSVNREQGNVTSEIAANIALARLYEGIAQTDSMFYYANTGFRMASGLKTGAQIASAAELMSTAFKRKGNIDSALTYLSVSKKMADSLNKVRTEKLTEFQNVGFEEQMRLEKVAQKSVASKNKIRTIGLITGLGLLSILAFVFYRNNRQKQKANTILQEQKQKVESTLHKLKSTQAQLIQSEKMASLGELTAGIAHEIQNPLNFVNNFSEVSAELVEEIQEARAKKQDEKRALRQSSGTEARGEPRDESEELEDEILEDIKKNLEKINHHGKRADAIVKGMLEHSRTGSGEKELTDINTLTGEYLNLAYQSFKSKNEGVEISLITDLDSSLPKIELVRADIGKVFLNILNNAFYAVTSKFDIHSTTADRHSAFDIQELPKVTIKTKYLENSIEISIHDNGPGIPSSIKEKIFQPFFTTKPTGQGTGLGLSLSYDIVKAHGGEIKVRSEEGKGTDFTIQIPI